MIITRKEFKELAALYKQQYDLYEEMCEYLQEDKVEEMIFPFLDWIEAKIGLNTEFFDGDIFHLIYSKYECGVAIDWEYDSNGNCYNIEYTKDLDLIYDKYILKRKK